jgi:hypothetical protein
MKKIWNIHALIQFCNGCINAWIIQIVRRVCLARSLELMLVGLLVDFDLKWWNRLHARRAKPHEGECEVQAAWCSASSGCGVQDTGRLTSRGWDSGGPGCMMSGKGCRVFGPGCRARPHKGWEGLNCRASTFRTVGSMLHIWLLLYKIDTFQY